MTGRMSRLYIVCGVNGTGKTQFVKKFLSKNQKRTLVINPTFEKKWDEFPKIKEEDAEELKTFTGIKQIQPKPIFGNMKKSFLAMLQLVWDNYYNGTMVIDDCREIISANLQDEVGSIMRGYRQHNLDLFTIFHSLNQVPPQVWEHSNGYLVMFKSQENWHKLKVKLPETHIALMEQTWKKVCHKANNGDPHAFEILKL